jgi:hypothetical protein
MFLRESIAANSHEGKFRFRLGQYRRTQQKRANERTKSNYRQLRSRTRKKPSDDRATTPKNSRRSPTRRLEKKVPGKASGQRRQATLYPEALCLAIGLLTADERELLRRTTLFEIPAPIAVLALLHPRHPADSGAATAAVERLFALGLLNRFENPLDFRRGHDHALVDALVRPKLEQDGPPS